MSYGESKIGTPWRGYYITAYGIAVKHGFKGTEEEWLESLVGKAVEIRYNDVTNVLEWSYAGEDVWTELLSLEDLQTEVVAQTLAQAEAAKQAAQNAQTAAEAAQSAAEAAQQEAEQNAGITQADASITQTNVQLTKEAKDMTEAAQQAAQNAQQAAEAAQAAAETAETGAEESATLSKSWAVGGTGTRPGEDTNNAEYWARQAAIAAGGGVLTFNGRTGNVTSEQGDYTPDQVGAADKTLSNLTNYQRALHNLSAMPGKNFADNSRFAKEFIVNQMGESSYTGNFNDPCIDRWRVWGSVTLEDDGIVVQSDEGVEEFFCQNIPDEYLSYLRGKQITMSVVYQESGVRKISSVTFVVAKEGDIDSPEVDINGIYFDLYKTSSTPTARYRFFNIAGGSAQIKLEAIEAVPGNHQTIVYTDDNGDLQFISPGNYVEELTKCQRYLLTGVFIIGVPVMVLSGGVGFFVPTPQTMRAKPVVIGSPKVYKFTDIDTPDKEVAISGFETYFANNGVYIYAAGNFDTANLYRIYFQENDGLSAAL